MNINDYIKKKSAQSDYCVKDSAPQDKGCVKDSAPQESDGESTQQLLDKYSTMNEEQLMQEMFRNASASRANGTLNDNMLDDFYNNACGYLTPEQSERMKELIRELKK